MSISAIIGAKITKFVTTVGVTLCLFGGTVLFYEGVFFLNWWPANQIPGYGWLVKGEINRRAQPMIEEAILKERTIWVELTQKMLEKRNKIITEKNDNLKKLALKNIATEDALRENHSEVISKLQKAINEKNLETIDEKSEPNPLHMRIPTGVYDNIR